MNATTAGEYFGIRPCRFGRGDFGFELANSTTDGIRFLNVCFLIICALCGLHVLVGCSNEPQGPNINSKAANAKPASANPQAASETFESPRPAKANSPSNSAKGNGQLRIAAASDLKFAIEEVRSQFASLHSGSTITVTYGSSGSFFAQLASEAPFDLFLAADIDYAHRLVEQGQGASDGEFSYARGHLVVWVPKDSPLLAENPGIDCLLEASVQKIVIANPKTAPYGRAAVAALKSLKAYDAVEPKVVFGENVAQAAQMVESGAADAGVIALSLAVSPALRDRGRYWQVPDGAYPPLVQGGLILRWAQDASLANDFRDFLRSGAGTAILKQFGFDEP